MCVCVCVCVCWQCQQKDELTELLSDLHTNFRKYSYVFSFNNGICFAVMLTGFIE